MTGNSKVRKTAPAGRILDTKIQAIYSSENESAANELTKLLGNALRDGDHHSRSALSEFFDLPAKPQTESSAAEIDFVLLSNVRVFINGFNANRVQAWILSYETSVPDSGRRSMYEKILRDFVASSRAVEALKSQVSQTYSLATDVLSKCDELKRIIKKMPDRRRAVCSVDQAF